MLYEAASKLQRKESVTFASDPNAVYPGLLWAEEKAELIHLAWYHEDTEIKLGGVGERGATTTTKVQVNYESTYWNPRSCLKLVTLGAVDVRVTRAFAAQRK